MSSFFNPQVVKRITEGRELAPGYGQQRDIIALSIDLRGFSVFSISHTPKEVMSTLSSYQKQVIPIITRNHGAIDKFMGDGMLIHFGAVDERPDYAANALRATEEIIKELTIWNDERVDEGKSVIQFGIGASLGTVVFGTVGNEERLEFTVIGKAVNSSAKFESHNKKLKTYFITTYRTYKAAVEQGYRPAIKYRKYVNQHVPGLPDALDLVGIPMSVVQQSGELAR